MRRTGRAGTLEKRKEVSMKIAKAFLIAVAAVALPLCASRAIAFEVQLQDTGDALISGIVVK